MRGKVLKMSEQVFEKYVEQGPDALTLDETKMALAWKDANPADALRITRQHEAQAREADEREALQATWEIQGGDPTVFEKAFPKMRAEQEAARLREIDEGAREQSLRLMRSMF
jgi:hypothetical protein